MRKNLAFFSAAAVLSVLFTVAFFFLMLESVRAVDELLLRFFPDSGSIGRSIRSLRPFGYAAFGATVVLMFLGFLLGRSGPSAVGAIAMYLPTFGGFALTMYPLAGIGVMYALWLPLLDFSPSLLELADIVYVPYNLLSSLLGKDGFVNVHGTCISISKPSAVLMGSGIFIFFLGVLTWIYGRSRGCKIVDFWIYRFSRHPQYLGFLLWSYGTLALELTGGPQSVWIAPDPSLPWLVSALTLIAVALNEEVKMVKEHGRKYLEYRSSTPFMLLLPKIVLRLATFPVKVLLKKDFPDNRKEIAYTILIYSVILILMSVLV